MPTRTAAVRGSIAALIVAKLAALCGVMPYGLVALGAAAGRGAGRVFCRPASPWWTAPTVPGHRARAAIWTIANVTLPAAGQGRRRYQVFQTQLAALPLPPWVRRRCVGAIEFIAADLPGARSWHAVLRDRAAHA